VAHRESPPSYFAADRPRVFGHRGAAGVAPENTLASFAVADALGADYLELDVHATLDGTIVVLHDPTLERTTDGHGPVNARRWNEVARLDAGYRFTHDGQTYPYRGQAIRIPALQAVLEQFPAQRFNIEIKQSEPCIVDQVIEIIERSGSTARTLLAAEIDDIMARIRAAGGGAATGMSAGDAVAFFDRLGAGNWEGYKPAGRALQIPVEFGGMSLVNDASIAAAHRCGLEMHIWTINEPAEIDRLLDLGVDGIMSDFPGRVRAAIESRARRRQ
jgi:glycerophosphoryl diester phosphodiesterase